MNCTSGKANHSAMNEPTAPRIACFGEILWDFLPQGAFPGGAPFNVAYHLHQLGLRAFPVSAVGRDVLGEELLRRLRNWGLPVEGIHRHYGLPTGYVTAHLSAAGDAHYEITPNVAWDQIPVEGDAVQLATQVRALVFGSLAQRSHFNRSTLDRLLSILPSDALRVFDVNLRAPHDDLELVRSLATRATLLKLNAAEAARLANEPDHPSGREETHARALAEWSGCPVVCVTAGAKGAGLLHQGDWSWVKARPTTVRDTVGAGDAFLAGLLAGLLLHHEPPATALARACRLGEFVAAHDGATPAYQLDLLGYPLCPRPGAE
jgi:fructokinase